MVVSDYVASLSTRPGGEGEWVHFYTDLIEDCLIQDEASLSGVQPVYFHGHQMDGLLPLR